MTSSIKLPRTWVTAKVRINPQGRVQLKITPTRANGLLDLGSRSVHYRKRTRASGKVVWQKMKKGKVVQTLYGAQFQGPKRKKSFW